MSIQESDDGDGVDARFAGWLVVVCKGKPALIIAVALGIIGILTIPLYIILTTLESDFAGLLVILYFAILLVVEHEFIALCASIIDGGDKDR